MLYCSASDYLTYLRFLLSICSNTFCLSPFLFSPCQTLTEPAIFAKETSCECRAPHERLTTKQARHATPGQSSSPGLSSCSPLHFSTPLLSSFLFSSLPFFTDFHFLLKSNIYVIPFSSPGINMRGRGI